MNHLFPHAQYAEDQPYSKTILTYHVLFRGWQSGALVGLGISGVRAFSKRRRTKPTLPSAIPRSTPLSSTLRSTGYASLVGFGLMVPGLAARMWGREEIEWQDRSWRLLHNPGQVEVDDWSTAGAVVGAVAGLRSPGVLQSGRVSALRVTGAAGVGTCVGIVGYMVWRYGVHGGKWPEISTS